MDSIYLGDDVAQLVCSCERTNKPCVFINYGEILCFAQREFIIVQIVLLFIEPESTLPCNLLLFYFYFFDSTFICPR